MTTCLADGGRAGCSFLMGRESTRRVFVGSRSNERLCEEEPSNSAQTEPYVTVARSAIDELKTCDIVDKVRVRVVPTTIESPTNGIRRYNGGWDLGGKIALDEAIVGLSIARNLEETDSFRAVYGVIRYLETGYLVELLFREETEGP